MPESTVDAPLLTDLFQKAFELASEIHRLQVRKKTGIPYLAHLMSVCCLVLEYSDSGLPEMDARQREDAAIAALLHDAIEDSDDGEVMLTRIRTSFGPEVASIVEGCSDSVAVPGVEKPAWRERKAAYLQKLEGEDEVTLLVSACDKLHNARAIVADLHAMGDALWAKFNAGKRDQLWYYGSLADVFQSKLDNPVSGELDRTVKQMGDL